MSHWDDQPVLSASDMDVIGSLFALRFVPGGSTGLVELYVEDDESYHFKTKFDRLWLADLKNVTDKALSNLEHGNHGDR